MALDGIGGVRPGQSPAGAPPPLGDIALTNAQVLGGKLRSGEIVSARVGADLGGGNVTLTVRGQTVVANSQLPLQPDTIVRLMVQSAGDQPVLRILGSPSSELASLSTQAARASALGLPSTPLVGVVLSAFEEAGAPLDPARLRDAVTQLQRAPVGEIPQRAQALALLAQAGLPTTPPFVALAERSAAGVLPNPAAAVAELQRAAQVVPPVVTSSTPSAVPTSLSNTTAAPAVPLAGQAVSSPGSASTPSSLPTTSAPAAVAPSSVTTQPQAVVPQGPVAGAQAPASVAQPVAGSGSAPMASAPVASTAGPDAGSPGGAAASTSPVNIANTTPGAATTATSAAASTASAGSSLPASPGTTTAVPATAVGAGAATPAPAPATTPLPLAPGAPVPASAAPATAMLIPGIPTTTTVAGIVVPDLARGGATAVLQALALAGVRPREAGELPVPKSEPTLLHRLDVPIEEPGPIRASIDTATRQPPHTPLDAAVVQIMREQAAETVVKPQSLVDYDVVLGLPLQVQGQPMPARLAVAERQTSGGRATFLRVDAELTHLGPLSVRISGIENGPMAITVMATGPALSALAEALPDLNESLRALGLTAGVRVADLTEDLARG